MKLEFYEGTEVSHNSISNPYSTFKFSSGIHFNKVRSLVRDVSYPIIVIQSLNLAQSLSCTG